MRAIGSIGFAAIVSVVVYLLTFTVVVKKPLTVGFIADALRLKQDYAAGVDRSKLVIIAGSNGLFSHRCEVMEPVVGMPCLNGSITAELGLGYMLELGQRLVKPGDTVLLPLEYSVYALSADQHVDGQTHPFRLTYDRRSIGAVPSGQLARALFQFDLRYLISALAEMMLDAIGIKRRFSAETMTRHGDMRGHTIEKGKQYRRFIEESESWLPMADEFLISPEARKVIGGFLEWARRNQVRVVATLPTMFDDRLAEAGLIAQLRSYYEGEGHEFLVLPNRNQYPRSCFYDTPYHLHQPCQIRHSRGLANALRQTLREAKP